MSRKKLTPFKIGGEDYLPSILFAQELGLTDWTVRQSRTTGILLGYQAPRYIRRGRNIYYSRSEISGFLKNFMPVQNTAEYISLEKLDPIDDRKLEANQ